MVGWSSTIQMDGGGCSQAPPNEGMGWEQRMRSCIFPVSTNATMQLPKVCASQFQHGCWFYDNYKMFQHGMVHWDVS